jgi:hypothetical protein
MIVSERADDQARALLPEPPLCIPSHFSPQTAVQMFYQLGCNWLPIRDLARASPQWSDTTRRNAKPFPVPMNLIIRVVAC